MFSIWKFDDKRPNEKVIIILKQHPIFLLKGIIISLIIIFMIVSMFYFFKINASTIIALIFGIFTIIFINLYYLYLWYNDLYVLTNQRIIDVDQKGLFNRVLAETSLDQIQEIKVQMTGPISHLLGIGTIVVQTAGPSENLILELVPNPFMSQKIINKAIFEYKNKITQSTNQNKENTNNQNMQFNYE